MEYTVINNMKLSCILKCHNRPSSEYSRGKNPVLSNTGRFVCFRSTVSNIYFAGLYRWRYLSKMF